MKHPGIIGLPIKMSKLAAGNNQDNTMRRKDREMDAAFALEVLQKAPYVTVSMTRPDGTPYAVPLSLAEGGDGETFYFHCAKEGEKLDCIRHNPVVCLSAVSYCRPVVSPKEGDFTLEYKSAIAMGRAELVEDENEKIEALRAICTRFLPHHMADFDDAVARSLQMTAVVRIKLAGKPQGKRKQYDSNGDEIKYGRKI